VLYESYILCLKLSNLVKDINQMSFLKFYFIILIMNAEMMDKERTLRKSQLIIEE
jgi:hypothetical protein